MSRLALVAALLASAACGPAGEVPLYRFRATAEGFTVSHQGGPERPFRPAGVNLGLAPPGTEPGEFAATPAQLDRWLEAASDLGLNCVRTYTVQSPELYEALRRWNLDHPDRPLFLMQGGWLVEPEGPEGDYLTAERRAGFEEELRRVVDVVHGNAQVPRGSAEHPENFGRAFGTFSADVSPWLLGYLVGRELEPTTVARSNARHPEATGHQGAALSIEGGSPIEAFITSQLDRLIVHERDAYSQEHPVGFSSWPTLDPLAHPTEPPYPTSSEELAQVDLLRVRVHEERYRGGLFFSYHAYPYYPDFVIHEPGYQVHDGEGLNSYLGYLRALREHYRGRTLIIGEAGLPTSQGSAHHTPSGLDHGGMSEQEHGPRLLRTLRTTVEAGTDGFFVFAIIDEWFKRAWVVDRVTLPAERRSRWFNAMNPEQNFGLIALRPGAEGSSHTVDGAPSEWTGAPQAQKAGGPLRPLDAFDPMRTLRSVQLSHDEGYLHVKLTVASLDPDGNGKLDWDQVRYTLAIDTVDPARGDFRLDPAGSVRTGRGVEFVVRLAGDADATLWVDKPYDLYGLWHGERQAFQRYRPVANDAGEFNLVRTLTNVAYVHQGTTLGPRVDQLTGQLPTGDERASSNSNFWYSVPDATLELRLPWGLLAVTDPSSRQAVDDDGSLPVPPRTSTIDAIAVMAVAEARAASGFVVADTLPAGTVSGDSAVIPSAGVAEYHWTGWEVPTWHERRKASFEPLREGLRELLGP